MLSFKNQSIKGQDLLSILCKPCLILISINLVMMIYLALII